MPTSGFCVRCRSSRACKRRPDCEFLSVADDGTVSVTLGRKLTAEEVKRLRTTGKMLAEVEQAAHGDALFAIAFGSAVSDFCRLDEDEWSDLPRGAPLFGSVTEMLSLRGEKLVRAILSTAVDDLYGRYNVLEWQHATSTEAWVASACKPPRKVMDARAKELHEEVCKYVKRALAGARRAAKTGSPKDAAAVKHDVAMAVRARLLFERLPVPSAPRRTDHVLDELDAEIDRLPSTDRGRAR